MLPKALVTTPLDVITLKLEGDTSIENDLQLQVVTIA